MVEHWGLGRDGQSHGDWLQKWVVTEHCSEWVVRAYEWTEPLLSIGMRTLEMKIKMNLYIYISLVIGAI